MAGETILGSVSQLWRYPASSLAGERLDAISVGTTTVVATGCSDWSMLPTARSQGQTAKQSGTKCR